MRLIVGALLAIAALAAVARADYPEETFFNKPIPTYTIPTPAPRQSPADRRARCACTASARATR